MRKSAKIPILAVALLTIIATAAIGPSLGIIELSFPGVNPTLIKSIVTIPALVCIPVSLLSNKVSRHMRKKYLLILGLIIYLIGAILCYFSNNIYMLLTSRGVLGIGLGIIAPMSLVLVGDFFNGKDRAKYMGYSSACSNIGGVIATPVVGFIAAANWHNIFLIYLVAFPILFIVIFGLPKVGPFDTYAPENRIEHAHDGDKHIKLNLGVFKYSIIIILAFITFYSVPTNIALLIQDRNFGNSEISAVLITLVTLFAFISAMLFGKVLKIFKETLILISFIIISIGLAVLILSSTLIFMGVGVILIGIGFGLIVPYSIFYSAKCVHNKHTSLAITIVTTSIYVGEAICPVVLDYIAKLLNLSNVIGSFYAAEILGIVAIIFSIIVIISSRVKENKIEEVIQDNEENIEPLDELVDEFVEEVTEEISFDYTGKHINKEDLIKYNNDITIENLNALEDNTNIRKELKEEISKELHEHLDQLSNEIVEKIRDEIKSDNIKNQEKVQINQKIIIEPTDNRVNDKSNNAVENLIREDKKTKSILLLGCTAMGAAAIYLLHKKRK
ncbi:MAG: MFS transporter [Clostridium perfringens]|nr:MFS transporter [Clostridium perfringens]